MNPVRAWNTFWFRPISARPLGVFRILIGLIALGQLWMISFDLDYWLTDQGLMQGTEARILAGPLRPSPLQWVQDPVSVRVFLGATAVVATLVTVGWHTRVGTVLLYLMMLSLHHRNIPTNCGPDTLLLVMLFYLMLSPSGAAYSLDARRVSRKRGTLAEPLIVPWAQRLIQLQLSLIYFDTAVLKSNGSTWLGGTAMHYAINLPELDRYDLSFLSQYPVFLNVLTYISLAVEFGLAVFLWFRPTRSWIAVAGILLHAGVLVIINVPIFGELMTACYLTFLGPDELDRLLHILNPRSWLPTKGTRPAVISGRVDPAESAHGPHNPASVTAAYSLTGLIEVKHDPRKTLHLISLRTRHLIARFRPFYSNPQ